MPIPALAYFTGTVVKSENLVTPGMIPVRCWKCGMYSEYALAKDSADAEKVIAVAD